MNLCLLSVDALADLILELRHYQPGLGVRLAQEVTHRYNERELDGDDYFWMYDEIRKRVPHARNLPTQIFLEAHDARDEQDAMLAKMSDLNEIVAAENALRKDREAKVEANPDYFDWPTGRRLSSENRDIRRLYGGSFAIEEGPLKRLGYICGARGAWDESRRRVLTRAFELDYRKHSSLEYLPNFYLQEWGDPQSANRLYKMAISICAFRDNGLAQMASRDMSSAVNHWDTDLKWLHDTYYVGFFGW